MKKTQIVMNPDEKVAATELSQKNYKNIAPNQKKEVLNIAAKDLVERFTPVFKKLANE